MKKMFIDTGAFLSRWVARDQHHEASRAAWATIDKQQYRLITSNFVLDETFTLLARRTSYRFAAERARHILTSDALVILRPDAEDELEALRWFEKFADHAVSYTDATSFVLMRQHRITQAFSFDRDFTDAGYTLWAGN